MSAWHRKMVLNGDRIKQKLFLILEHLLKCPWIVHQPLRIQELGQRGIGGTRHDTIFVAVVRSRRGRCRCRHIFSSIGISPLYSLLSSYMRYTRLPRCSFHQIINIFHEPMTQYLVCDRLDRDQHTTKKTQRLDFHLVSFHTGSENHDGAARAK